MSIETCRAYLRQRGYEDRIQEFDVSSATVELAAQAVGCEPAHIAKTLSFLHEDGAVLIVCAGDAKIDNSKFKAQFHHKATMLTPEQVEAFTGHQIGGVCPFGITHPNTVTYLDISLQRFDTIYPAAGNAASAVRLNCDELAQLSNSAGWIDVCKGWQAPSL
ncbi:EbsC protein [Flavonifractor sp. An52]|uniref:YbaK/EbsC family protein n=1 Tax=Flavonifractor sp. An52 TaxID=1965642 RepID=UPI000B398AA5|nr:YbaK/EbsC family protein [Flavonifractor sp. An52]OUN80812.1 EbsC protein [Flavonifractor sp. An52]